MRPAEVQSSPSYLPPRELMPRILVLISLAAGAACSASTTSPAVESSPGAPGFDPGGRCFAVQTTGEVAPDFVFPRIIQLTREPAPNFVEPGPLAVREPAVREPRAPISWWRPTGEGSIELVLGGGFTGYSFSLTRAGAAWVGQGKYCADFGLEPAPKEVTLRLTRQDCP